MSKAKSQLAIQLASARQALKAQKAIVVNLAAKVKAENQAAKATKVETAIAKAQARLQKLMSKQVGAVGAKAVKAAKRPSKGVVLTGAEAQAALAK
jgi:hypothetical protein